MHPALDFSSLDHKSKKKKTLIIGIPEVISKWNEMELLAKARL